MEQEHPEKIALFVTCLVDQMFPEVGVAAVKLLRRSGFEVEFPVRQTCCGQPFYSSGFLPEAKKLAKQTIDIFEPYDAVVVPGGSCTGMMREESLHLFEDDPEWYQRASSMAGKFFELSEFLAAHVELHPRTDEPFPVTYHDSCHMLRIAGIKDPPRQLLEQVGCEIHEMEESERCCGFGGLFSVRMHEVSQAMTSTKLNRVLETKTNVVVTSDAGCMLQMRGHRGPDRSLQIEHLAVILEKLSQ